MTRLWGPQAYQLEMSASGGCHLYFAPRVTFLSCADSCESDIGHNDTNVTPGRTGISDLEIRTTSGHKLERGRGSSEIRGRAGKKGPTDNAGRRILALSVA